MSDWVRYLPMPLAGGGEERAEAPARAVTERTPSEFWRSARWMMVIPIAYLSLIAWSVLWGTVAEAFAMAGRPVGVDMAGAWIGGLVYVMAGSYFSPSKSPAVPIVLACVQVSIHVSSGLFMLMDGNLAGAEHAANLRFGCAGGAVACAAFLALFRRERPSGLRPWQAAAHGARWAARGLAHGLNVLALVAHVGAALVGVAVLWLVGRALLAHGGYAAVGRAVVLDVGLVVIGQVLFLVATTLLAFGSKESE